MNISPSVLSQVQVSLGSVMATKSFYHATTYRCEEHNVYKDFYLLKEGQETKHTSFPWN